MTKVKLLILILHLSENRAKNSDLYLFENSIDKKIVTFVEENSNRGD